MKMLCLSEVLALVVGAVLSAQAGSPNPTGPQSGPDLSGGWNREAASASPGGDSAGWGQRIEIAQSGVNVTIQPSPGRPARYRLDGKETAVQTTRSSLGETTSTMTTYRK